MMADGELADWQKEYIGCHPAPVLIDISIINNLLICMVSLVRTHSPVQSGWPVGWPERTEPGPGVEPGLAP